MWHAQWPVIGGSQNENLFRQKNKSANLSLFKKCAGFGGENGSKQLAKEVIHKKRCLENINLVTLTIMITVITSKKKQSNAAQTSMTRFKQYYTSLSTNFLLLFIVIKKSHVLFCYGCTHINPVLEVLSLTAWARSFSKEYLRVSTPSTSSRETETSNLLSME